MTRQLHENVGIEGDNRKNKHHVHSEISQEFIKCTPPAARDWHKEMIMGLFLRSDENELSALSKQLPDRNKKNCEPGHHRNTMIKKRPRDEEIKTFIPDVLSRSSDSNLLNVLPHIFSKNDMQYRSFKTQEDSTKVRKWVRRSYRSHSLQELKNEAMVEFEKSLKSDLSSSPSNEGKPSDSTESSFSPMTYCNKDTSSKNYRAVALKYNECSIAAISKWAATNMSTSLSKEEQNKQDTCAVFSRPGPAPLFRRCSVCDKWGHYETECAELRKNDFKELASLVKVQRTLRDFVEEEFFFSSEKRLNSTTNNPPLISTSNEEPVLSIAKSIVSKVVNIDNESDGISSTSTGTISGCSNNPDDDYLTKSTACQICESSYHGEDLLLCDGCDGLFHRQCLDPPLKRVPDGDWFCPSCVSYDSDVSSIAELEACGGFVIEQRKRSMAQDPAYLNEKNMRVGFSTESWSAVVSVTKKDELSRHSTPPHEHSQQNDDEAGLFKHTQKNSNYVESKKPPVIMDPGELCWAKREAAPIGKLGRTDWWPAMIIQATDTRLSKKAKHISHSPYVVKMFALPGAGRVRASAVLPFFPHYEEIGHKRLTFSRGQEGYNEFRRALDESLSEIGCKNIGEALKQAREIMSNAKEQTIAPTRESTIIEDHISTSNQISTPSNRNVKLNCHLRPVEWRDADESEIDGIVILSRRQQTPDSELPQYDLYNECKKKIWNSNSLEAKLKHNQSIAFSPPKEELPPLNSLMGGIVTWVIRKASSTHNYLNVRGNSPSNLQMGVVVGFNAVHQKILVRCLPTLNNVAASIAAAKIQDSYDDTDDDNSTSVHACPLGPSMWVNIDCVTHISDGPSKKTETASTSIVSNSLKEIQDQIRNRILDEATKREENTVELVSLTSSHGESLSLGESVPENPNKSSEIATHSEKRNQGELATPLYTSNRTISSSLSSSKSQTKKLTPATATGSNRGSQVRKSTVKDKNKLGRGGEGIYVAEKILDVRQMSCSAKKEYLIQWKGFPKEDSTWEPVENIFNQSLFRLFNTEQIVKFMKLTVEVKDTKSLTYRMMKVLEKGLKKVGERNNQDKAEKRKSRACPFCGCVMKDGSAFGGHVKMHSKEPNYKLIRDAYKTIVEENWISEFQN